MGTSISRFAAACALAAACAASPASRSTIDARPYRAYAHNSIGLVELAELQPDMDAYGALQTIRPQFLRVRPGSSLFRGEQPSIRVYVNGNYVGDLSALRTLYVRNIVSIRRLQRMEMHLAPVGGLRPDEGAILVTLR